MTPNPHPSNEPAERRLLPELDPDIYVYCQLPLGSKLPFRPRMVFEEREGLTILINDYQARSLGYEAHFPCRRIILGVDSQLADIGLIAQVSTALAEAGIPCNVGSAFSHDHIFVPFDLAKRATEILADLRW